MRDSKHILAGVAAFIVLAGSCVERAIAQSAPETTGPYKVVMEMDPSLPEHTVYRPEQVRSVKGKRPVVAYGNGACANAGNAFENYLAEVASHGFLVWPTGRSIQRRRAGRDPNPDSPFLFFPRPQRVRPRRRRWSPALPAKQNQPTVRDDGLGQRSKRKDGSPYKVTSWYYSHCPYVQSCGGLQALEAAGDPRVKTAVILNPGIIRNTVPLSEGEGQNKGAPMRVPIAGLVLPGNPETLKKLHTPVIS